MLVKIYGSAVYGIDSTLITIEVNVSRGAKFILVGLPDSAIKESKERIHVALYNQGFRWPGFKVVVNMSPADLRKEGSAYDLPIAIGVLVAQHLNVPFVYVRPEPKSHGRKNQVEGLLEKNKNVVVVEDLISTGKSSLNAVQALKDEGANVKGMVAIFSYGFEIANENFSKANVKLNTLSDYNHLLEQSLDSKYISEAELDTLKKWRENPSEWGLINS